MSVHYMEPGIDNSERVLRKVRELIEQELAGFEDDDEKRQAIAERLGVVPSGIEVLLARPWSIDGALEIAELLGIAIDVVDAGSGRPRPHATV